MMSAQTVITRKKPALFTAVAMGALLAISGCASNQGARDYKSSEVGQVTRIDEGTIVSAEPIMIEGREGYLGAATGAVIGGIAGSQIGGGDDEKAIAGVIGAVGGGIAGRQVEKSATKKPGYRYTIRLTKSGELITIVQGGDVAMANGTPVYIQYGERARVVPRDVGLGY